MTGALLHRTLREAVRINCRLALSSGDNVVSNSKLATDIKHKFPFSESLPSHPSSIMFTNLSAMNSSLTLYGTEYTETRAAYLLAAKNLKEATGPYKATRDAYVAATATYTKSLYE